MNYLVVTVNFELDAAFQISVFVGKFLKLFVVQLLNKNSY